MRRTKGFTLVELLVVIAIIALLMGILMPALARVRAIAFRMTCGTNLAGIGKAMLIYANDYQEEFPLGGWSNSQWTYNLTPLTDAWKAGIREGAFGGPPPTASYATVTSCFYALVKFADVTTKSFICKSDSGATEFDVSKFLATAEAKDFGISDAWDFGPWIEADKAPGNADWRCSYAYHLSLGNQYALTTASEPGMAVAADPNPWFKHTSTNPKSDSFPGSGESGPYGSVSPFRPDGSTENIKFGNAFCHQEEGQNVLFLDGHVSFEKNSFCGIEEDNIYTTDNGSGPSMGDPKANYHGDRAPDHRKDSYLVGNRAAINSP